ncbi:unnamed protein product, partial [marine sediment metagenome]
VVSNDPEFQMLQEKPRDRPIRDSVTITSDAVQDAAEPVFAGDGSDYLWMANEDVEVYDAADVNFFVLAADDPFYVERFYGYFKFKKSTADAVLKTVKFASV